VPARISVVAPHEVAIIGGGPAGAAAANLLAAWGHRVVLVHRSADAQRPALAESIPPSCRKLFAALGVLEAIDAAGFERSSGNTVWWGHDEVRCEMFEGAPGYQVERSRFDALLRGEATAAGAELQDGVVGAVRNSAGTGGATLVCTDERTFPAEFVLDCSGRAGVVARRAWRVSVTGHPRTVGLVGVWRCVNGWPDVEPTHTLVESYGDGWAWSVPLSRDTRYLTTMVDPHRTELARGRPARDVYLAELRKARHLARLSAVASMETGPWGCDASVYASRTYAQAPFLLVGDAASFVDPLSSFGIKKALASAWLASIAVHTALRNPAMTTAALDFFAARERDMAVTLLDQARAYFGDAAAAHRHPFWIDRADPIELPAQVEPDVRALRDDPRVQRAFAAIRSHARLLLRPGAAVRAEPRPMVRGREIVLEDRLFTPSLPGGVRFLRDVDVVGILGLVSEHDQVPALFDTYNHRFPPVALPDFLGALAVMLAFGVADDAAATAGS
jgi:2-polyprenyl-6-methoxyphenol hydroxylase-like FAD-dependent oxidoreductase